LVISWSALFTQVLPRQGAKQTSNFDNGFKVVNPGLKQIKLVFADELHPD
jgi:hypothetical protein